MKYKLKKKLFIYIFIIALIIILDLTTKIAIRENFNYLEPVNIAGDYIRFSLIYNEGINVSFFSDLSFSLRSLLKSIMSVIAFLLLFLFYLIIRKSVIRDFVPSLDLSATFVAGGALSNIIERFIRNKVTDFIDIGIGSFRWNIFNIADIFVFFGVIIMITIMFTHPSSNDGNTKETPI